MPASPSPAADNKKKTDSSKHGLLDGLYGRLASKIEKKNPTYSEFVSSALKYCFWILSGEWIVLLAVLILKLIINGYPFYFPVIVLMLYIAALLRYACAVITAYPNWYSRLPRPQPGGLALVPRFLPYLFTVKNHIKLWALHGACSLIFIMEKHYDTQESIKATVFLTVTAHMAFGFVKNAISRKVQLPGAWVFKWGFLLLLVCIQGYVFYLFKSAGDELREKLKVKGLLFLCSIMMTFIHYCHDQPQSREEHCTQLNDTKSSNSKQKDSKKGVPAQEMKNENLIKPGNSNLKEKDANAQLNESKKDNISKPIASSHEKRNPQLQLCEQKKSGYICKHAREIIALEFIAISVFVYLSITLPGHADNGLYTSQWLILTILFWYLLIKTTENGSKKIGLRMYLQVICCSYIHFALQDGVDTSDPWISVPTFIFLIACAIEFHFFVELPKKKEKQALEKSKKQSPRNDASAAGASNISQPINDTKMEQQQETVKKQSPSNDASVAGATKSNISQPINDTKMEHQQETVKKQSPSNDASSAGATKSNILQSINGTKMEQQQETVITIENTDSRQDTAATQTTAFPNEAMVDSTVNNLATWLYMSHKLREDQDRVATIFQNEETEKLVFEKVKKLLLTEKNGGKEGCKFSMDNVFITASWDQIMPENFISSLGSLGQENLITDNKEENCFVVIEKEDYLDLDDKINDQKVKNS